MSQKLNYVFKNEPPYIAQCVAPALFVEIATASLWMSFEEWLTWLHAELEFMAWQQQTLSDDGCPHHND